MRDSLRRAYAASRESVRAARAEARAAEADDEAPASRRAEVEASVPYRPIVVAPQPTPTQRDDLDVPRGLRVAGAWAWRLLLLVAAGLAMIWVLARLQLVVVPLIIALLLSALLAPLARLLWRRGLPRSLATTIVVVGGIATLIGVLTLVVNQFVVGAPALSAKAGE